MSRGANPGERRWPGLCVILLLAGACGGTEASDLFGEPATGGTGGTVASGGHSGEAESSAGMASSPGGMSGSPAQGGTTNGGSTAGASASAGMPQSGGQDGGAPVGGAGNTDGGTGDPGSSGGQGGTEPSGGTPGTDAGSGGSGGSGGLLGVGASSNAGEGGQGGQDGQGGKPGCDPAARERCDGLDNDCDGEPEDDAACPKGCFGRAIDGRGYMFCLRTERTFDAAREACGKSGMHLVWIDSEEENDAIVRAVRDAEVEADRAWIGGSDAENEGDWRWLDVDGTPRDAFWSGEQPRDGGMPVDDRYVNWGEGRPNDSENRDDEDCLSLTLDRKSLDTGTWNDDACDSAWPFVCEAP